MSDMPTPEKEKHGLDPEIEKQLPAPLADAIRSGSISADILKHSQDADEAMKVFQSHQGQVLEIDEATNKRLLRRIDWNLMPVGFQTNNASNLILIISLPDHVRGVWFELSRQNHYLVRLGHGDPGRYWTCG